MKLKIYSPLKITYGDAFQSKWCINCKFFIEKKIGRIDGFMDCSKKMIISAMFGESQWLYNEEGDPFCPKFKNKNRNEKPKPRQNQLSLF